MSTMSWIPIPDGEEPDFLVVDKYRPPELEDDEQLRGNPMALVFPPPMDDEELLPLLQKRRRKFPPGWKAWTLAARLSLLEGLRSFHHVSGWDLDNVSAVVAKVRESYRQRDPRNAKVMQAILEFMSGNQRHVPRLTQTGGGGGLGMLLTGPNGVGKSSFKDRLLKHLGAYGRVHTSLNGEPARWPQLGVIAVNVETTWIDTLKAILQEVNRQLGRPIFVLSSRATTGNIKQYVGAALSIGWAPILIVDELQRLSKLSERTAKEILEGMINLMEQFGIPVLLIGTMRVRALFRRYPFELAKFASGGTKELMPMNLDPQDPNTGGFLEILKSQSVSLKPIAYSDDFDQLLLRHTMGVKRLLVEYMRCVFERHAMDEAISVDGGLLQKIAEKEMADFEPAVSILRKQSLGLLLDFDDYQLYEDSLESALQSRQQSLASFRFQVEWLANTKSNPKALMSAAEHVKAERRIAELEQQFDVECRDAAKMAKTQGEGASTPTPKPRLKVVTSTAQSNQEASPKRTAPHSEHLPTTAITANGERGALKPAIADKSRDGDKSSQVLKACATVEQRRKQGVRKKAKDAIRAAKTVVPLGAYRPPEKHSAAEGVDAGDIK